MDTVRAALVVIPIDDAASVSVVRQRVRSLGVGLPPDVIERAALVASELGHNQLQHARLGDFDVVRHPGGLELIAMDAGGGLTSPVQAFSGAAGSTGKGLGIGLAGVRRACDGLDLCSFRNEGTTLRARIGAFSPRPREYVLLGRPHPDEHHSGDDAAVVRIPEGLVAVMADGLGHGPEARRASRQAIQTVKAHPDEDPVALLERCDEALRATRGAAVAVARIGRDTLEVASAGNIRVVVLRPRDAVRVPAVSRVVGMGRGQRFRSQVLPVVGSTMLFATDGIPERDLPTSLERPGWPLALAHDLLQVHGRSTDDATVLAIR